MENKILQLVASLLGLIGGIILAYSLNRVLSETRLAVTALSTSIQSLAQSHNVYLFEGLDVRLLNANRIAGSWVRAGIYCLTGSAVLTSISIFS